MQARHSETWTSALSSDELLGIVQQSQVMARYEFAKDSIDTIGNATLPRAIDGPVMYAMWPDYWERLKCEFKILLCTNDKKYAHLRKELGVAAKKSQTAIVSMIAAAMASAFGVVAGVLVPFCALCLVAVAKLGREAFCTVNQLVIPPQ
jgi:hypothetical protein